MKCPNCGADTPDIKGAGNGRKRRYCTDACQREYRKYIGSVDAGGMDSPVRDAVEERKEKEKEAIAGCPVAATWLRVKYHLTMLYDKENQREVYL